MHIGDNNHAHLDVRVLLPSDPRHRTRLPILPVVVVAGMGAFRQQLK